MLTDDTCVTEPVDTVQRERGGQDWQEAGVRADSCSIHRALGRVASCPAQGSLGAGDSTSAWCRRPSRETKGTYGAEKHPEEHEQKGLRVHPCLLSVDGEDKEWDLRHHISQSWEKSDLEGLFAQVHDSLTHSYESGCPLTVPRPLFSSIPPGFYFSCSW